MFSGFHMIHGQQDTTRLLDATDGCVFTLGENVDLDASRRTLPSSRSQCGITPRDTSGTSIVEPTPAR
jgi:hypothetical protein